MQNSRREKKHGGCHGEEEHGEADHQFPKERSEEIF